MNSLEKQKNIIIKRKQSLEYNFKHKNSHNNQSNIEVIRTDMNLPNIMLTEFTNKGIHPKPKSLEHYSIKLDVIKKHKKLHKEYGNNETAITSNDILPNISNVNYRNINVDFDESKEKKDLKVLNAKLYLNYRKNYMNDKNFLFPIKNSVIQKNSKQKNRISSGTYNLRKILNEYSSFNKDYLSRMFSPKNNYSEPYNIFDQKPGSILKRELLKDSKKIIK